MWILDVNKKLDVSILIQVKWYLTALGMAFRITVGYVHSF